MLVKQLFKKKILKDDRRKDKAVNVFLTPDERYLVKRYEHLSGRSFTEQVREHWIKKLPSIIGVLEEMVESGLTPGELPDTTEVIYVETDDERKALRQDDFVPVDLDVE